MEKIKLLVENAFKHKEQIEPSLAGAIKNRSHYNSESTIFPKILGRGNYLDKCSGEHFQRVLGRMKRSYGVDDIPPDQYFQFKTGINDIFGQIQKHEKPHLPNLYQLAEQITRDSYSLPQDIQLKYDTADMDSLGQDNLLDSYKDKFDDYKFDDYGAMESANASIDRSRANYCLICGGAGDSMKSYANWSDSLDSIDHRLHGLYDKVNSFNDFNLWVSPDEVLTKEIDDKGGFKVIETGNGYTIIVDAPNFLSALYESSKAVLSILFQEKYNNPHVDYDDPWNNRIGSMLWPKFMQSANRRKNFPYVIDAINELNDDDYTYVMHEVFSGTNHAKQMFSELYESF